MLSWPYFVSIMEPGFADFANLGKDLMLPFWYASKPHETLAFHFFLARLWLGFVSSKQTFCNMA